MLIDILQNQVKLLTNQLTMGQQYIAQKQKEINIATANLTLMQVQIDDLNNQITAVTDPAVAQSISDKLTQIQLSEQTSPGK